MGNNFWFKNLKQTLKSLVIIQLQLLQTPFFLLWKLYSFSCFESKLLFPMLHKKKLLEFE